MWWILGIIIAVIIMMVLVVILKGLVDNTKLPTGTVIKIGRTVKNRECIVGTFYFMNVTACATEDIKAGEAEICGHQGELYLIRNISPNLKRP